MSYMAFTESPSVPCRKYPLGECYDGLCMREHHPNLSPYLRDYQEQEFEVSKEPGVACQRCLQTMRECDKRGRGGEDDPCSECRWFGGEECRCTIIQDWSYNDQAWTQMMMNADEDYTIFTAPRRRDVDANPDGSAPIAMPAARVKPDWRGESRDELLAKEEMLPYFVRELPRAYLDPSWASLQNQETAASNASEASEGQSDGEDSDVMSFFEPSTSASALPQYPAPWYPRPPADPIAGEVVAQTWSWKTGMWRFTYANGVEVTTWPSDRNANAPPPSADTSVHCTLSQQVDALSLSGQYSNALAPSTDHGDDERPSKKRRTMQQAPSSSAVTTQQPTARQSAVEQGRPDAPQETFTSMEVDVPAVEDPFLAATAVKRVRDEDQIYEAWESDQ